MDILERLIRFKERNPDIKQAVEDYFPETIDKSPFIMANQFFLRRLSATNDTNTHLYQLLFRKGVFMIKNLSLDSYWKGKQRPTNDAEQFADYYLSEYDFIRLIKQSGVSAQQVKVLPTEGVKLLYKKYYSDFQWSL